MHTAIHTDQPGTHHRQLEFDREPKMNLLVCIYLYVSKIEKSWKNNKNLSSQIFVVGNIVNDPLDVWSIYLITWLSEVYLTSLIALFWSFPLMICNFPLLLSHSKNIRMSTLITIVITCHIWLTRNHMVIHEIWGKFT